MRALGYRVIDILVDHLREARETPVQKYATLQTLESLLREPVPDGGSDVNDVLRQLERDVFPYIARHDHPRFFAFVPSPSNFVSVMAETLAAGYNVTAGTWGGAPGPVELEVVTIDWLRQLFGMPESAGGLFVSGGSMANLTALAAARHIRLNDRLNGAVAYCSDQTHSSVARAFHLLGFAPDQLRILPSDDELRLPLDILHRRVTADRRAGGTPFCVVANAGTTNTGAVDSLPQLADLCAEENMWLHADASYGGPAVLSESGRSALVGLDRLDSVSLDPHKWLFQPYEMGCVLVRRGDHLRQTFLVHADYLQDLESAGDEVNFCDYGVQLTRGFRALKLWMSLKVFGLDAFRKAVSHGIALAEAAERMLRASDVWEVVTPAQLGLITFRYRLRGEDDSLIDDFNRDLVGAMREDGFAFLSSTLVQGRVVLRLCTINPRTTETDLESSIRRLEALARRRFKG